VTKLNAYDEITRFDGTDPDPDTQHKTACEHNFQEAFLKYLREKKVIIITAYNVVSRNRTGTNSTVYRYIVQKLHRRYVYCIPCDNVFLIKPGRK
jgi:hypothetical protein